MNSRRFITAPKLRGTHSTDQNQNWERCGRCPLRVKSRHVQCTNPCPLYPQ